MCTEVWPDTTNPDDDDEEKEVEAPPKQSQRPMVLTGWDLDYQAPPSTREDTQSDPPISATSHDLPDSSGGWDARFA